MMKLIADNTVKTYEFTYLLPEFLTSAEVLKTTEEVEKSGFDFIKDNAVPGTAGLPSLRKLVAEGNTILTF